MTSVMRGEEAGNTRQSRMFSRGRRAAKTTPGGSGTPPGTSLAGPLSRLPVDLPASAWKTVTVTRSGRYRRSCRRALAGASARLRGGHASRRPTSRENIPLCTVPVG